MREIVFVQLLTRGTRASKKRLPCPVGFEGELFYKKIRGWHENQSAGTRHLEILHAATNICSMKERVKEVLLNKSSGEAVGVTLTEVGWPFTTRVIIDNVNPTSVLADQVDVNDRLLSVGGEDVMSAEHAAQLLRKSSRSTLMLEEPELEDLAGSPASVTPYFTRHALQRLVQCLGLALLLLVPTVGVAMHTYQQRAVVARERSTSEMTIRERDRAQRGKNEALRALDNAANATSLLRQELHLLKAELQLVQRANETGFEESRRARAVVGRLRQQLVLSNTSWAARARRQVINYRAATTRRHVPLQRPTGFGGSVIWLTKASAAEGVGGRPSCVEGLSEGRL